MRFKVYGPYDIGVDKRQVPIGSIKKTRIVCGKKSAGMVVKDES